MCGIVGLIDFALSSTEEQLIAMRQTLLHRGPDAQAHTWYQHPHALVGLGHTRLSILDTSASGHQPMVYGKYTIVLNGEIYNFREIRKVLQDKGHSFRSTSDTEVVLHAFAEWNTKCVEKFIGMFAFVIYDAHANKVYLCRDRVGVKPLFYYWENGLFLFGSELKAFHRHPRFRKEIRQDALALYLRYGYVPGPISIFKNVSKLDPGHWLTLDLEHRVITKEQYWDVETKYRQKPLGISYEDACGELEDLLISSCQYRMVSDVPIGLFLSGGFDSTLVAALLQSNSTAALKTFTIGFPDGVDEAPFARTIANHLGTDHTTYNCTEADAKAILPELSYYYDEPSADVSAIPTILVSREAGKKVKVALSADGGDELFAGYSGFKTFVNEISSIRRIPFPGMSAHALELVGQFIPERKYALTRKLEEVVSVLRAKPANQLEVLLEKSSGIPPGLLKKLLPPGIDISNHNALQGLNGLGDYRSALFLSGIKRTMRDLLLVKVDRASMSAGLESREPLLDHRLIEYSAQLPYAYKHDGVTSKRILRDIVYKYVPKQLMDRPKTGFDLPIFKWLRGDMKYLLDEYLDPRDPALSALFDGPMVQQLLRDFKNNKLVYKDIIWRILFFRMWYQRWIENKNT